MARLWSGDAGLRLMHEDRDVCRCRPTFRLFDAKLDQVVGTESAATAQCAAMHVEVRVTSAHDKSVLLARVVPLYLPAHARPPAAVGGSRRRAWEQANLAPISALLATKERKCRSEHSRGFHPDVALPSWHSVIRER